MFHWFETRADFDAFTRRLEPLRSIVETHLDRLPTSAGYCAACRTISLFRVRGQRGSWRGGRTPIVPSRDDSAASWLNLRESLICETCGLNGRMRMLYVALESEVAGAPDPLPVVMFERLTPLFAKVAARFPFVEGCEYVDGSASGGSVHDVGGTAVRHEDMLQLSWPAETWSIVVHGDVLEHVPDHRRALEECCRVLRPGGSMLFTCPFFDLESHVVRCTLKDDRLVHHLPPVYHGNPVSPDGSLVFAQHGWPLLDDVRAAGFSRVSIGLLYDVFQGILSSNNPHREGFMWPVLFRAVK